MRLKSLLDRGDRAGEVPDSGGEPPAVPHRRGAGVRRRILIGVGLVAVGIVGAEWLTSLSSPVHVADIEVVGVTGDLKQSVDLIAAGEVGQPFRSVDEDRLVEQILTIEGIDGAQLEWTWPAVLQVTVRSQTPVAATPTPNRNFVVIDADGDRIREVAKAPKGLPVLRATGARSARAGIDLLGQLPADVKERLAQVTVTDPGNMVLLTRNGTTVVWGSAELTDAKVEVFRALRATKAEGFDISVPTRPALLGGLADDE